MAKCKRAMVTLRPECEPELLQLKKDMSYNDTQAEMYRQLIRRGLEFVRTESKYSDEQQRESK